MKNWAIMLTPSKKIQNVILTAIDIINATRIELAIRSKTASSGREAASVSAISERNEQVGITDENYTSFSRESIAAVLGAPWSCCHNMKDGCVRNQKFRSSNFL